MAPRFKDFGSPVAQSDEPIVFQLYGEQFRAIPAMQGQALIEVIKESVDSNNPAGQASVIMDFFEKVLVPESFEAFDAMLRSTDRIVPMEKMAEVMEWLMEEYAGRPTQPSAPSLSGDMITGPMPVAVPSLPPDSVSVL